MTVKRVEDVDAAAEKSTWSEGDFTIDPLEDNDEAVSETTVETQLSAKVTSNTGR